MEQKCKTTVLYCHKHMYVVAPSDSLYFTLFFKIKRKKRSTNGEKKYLFIKYKISVSP